MTQTAPATPAAPTPVALVVFGADEAGKAHASAFTVEEAELAERAADLMDLRVFKVADTDEHRALAQRLPVGRVFASGRAFVPFVKKPLFEALCAMSGLSAETELARKVKAAGSAATSAMGATDSPPDLPLHWSAVKPGSLVLAADGVHAGWYESIVVEDKGDALFVLKWRDWPDEPNILRRRDQLGLLPLNEAVTG